LSNLAEIHTELKQSIVNTQNHYKKSADNHCSPAPKIDISNCVFVSAKFIKTTCPSKKLSEKFLGPFKVSDKLGSHFYCVKLPHHLRAIHPVFHISQLEPTSSNQIPNCTKNSSPSIKLDETLEFKVVQVLDSKFDRHKKDSLLYYIQWSGYENMTDEYSWLVTSDLKNATELVANFYRHYPNKLHFTAFLFSPATNQTDIANPSIGKLRIAGCNSCLEGRYYHVLVTLCDRTPP